jgi:hypothetical protein
MIFCSEERLFATDLVLVAIELKTGALFHPFSGRCAMEGHEQLS